MIVTRFELTPRPLPVFPRSKDQLEDQTNGAGGGNRPNDVHMLAQRVGSFGNGVGHAPGEQRQVIG